MRTSVQIGIKWRVACVNLALALTAREAFSMANFFTWLDISCGGRQKATVALPLGKTTQEDGAISQDTETL